MHRLVCGIALCLLLAGCPGSVDEVILTPNEAQALMDNVEGALEVQQLLTKFAFEAARGDLDISGYTYDPPTVDNGWTGSLTLLGGSFPFGTGDLTLTFTVVGDGGPVDPYADFLGDDSQVTIDGVLEFVGISSVGDPVDVSADFVAQTVQNAADSVVARINGLFVVDYASYVADLAATDLDVTIDIVQDEIMQIFGSLDATVDIPSFQWDAVFDLDGLGDELSIGFEIAGLTIDYVLSLADLL